MRARVNFQLRQDVETGLLPKCDQRLGDYAIGSKLAEFIFSFFISQSYLINPNRASDG